MPKDSQPFPVPVAFVLKGYPRLSETFIAQEILSLERAGLDIRLFSMRHPTDRKRHPIHAEIKAPVTYLPEYLHDEPLRVLRAWLTVRRWPGYEAALKAYQWDFRRDISRNRVRRFGQAMVLATECPSDVRWLHAHFIHTPASVVRYAALMMGFNWSCSAHAKDIWTSQNWELSEKLAEAQWTVTCTAHGAEHLRGLSASPERVHLSYHGLDLSRFPAPENERPTRDGTDPANPLRLLSVGRAVEKKGFDLLIDALGQLPSNLHWTFEHIGGGSDLALLKKRAASNGIDRNITWHGAQAQERVLQAYRDADIFVLPCRIAKGGDRDGLPNVIVEAQSQGLACISTAVSGVTELLQDGLNGHVCPPEDSRAIAQAVTVLAEAPDTRIAMGKAGQGIVHERFDHAQSIRDLERLFQDTLPRPDQAPHKPFARAAE
ncbi:MAG: glycosyltransferase family 4 protein [Pseudomonadota bacterium]